MNRPRMPKLKLVKRVEFSHTVEGDGVTDTQLMLDMADVLEQQARMIRDAEDESRQLVTPRPTSGRPLTPVTYESDDDTDD
jgi:hypothetical protein